MSPEEFSQFEKSAIGNLKARNTNYLRGIIKG
jgi:hypothetical protein